MKATKEDFEDAAEELMAAADYLKTALDEGQEIEEGRWLGAIMQAHGLLLEKADSEQGDDPD